jgi:predicted negative regulator of RcsB-dependent stress response
MASPLDLQEQEQLDTLKALWKQYGNLVTWVLLIALGAMAAWNGWQWYQRDQGSKAAAMFDELDRAAQGGDADKAGRIFADLQSRYPGTAFAQQGGLAAARVQFEKGQLDAAKASLSWVADKAVEVEARTMARLRLAAVQAEAKQYDEALKTLDGATAAGFEALVADRRGDILMAQGKAPEALAAFKTAWAGLSEGTEYKRVVEAKLVAMGASPKPLPGVAAEGVAAPASAVAAGASSAGAASAAASGASK